MLNINCRKEVKVVVFECETENGPLTITVTAERLLGTPWLEMDFTICEPDERISVSCGKFIVSDVKFEEESIVDAALKLLEKHEDTLLEHYAMDIEILYGK